jgi:hypothetical protein
MGLPETLIFYGTVGIAVAVSAYVRSDSTSAGARVFRVCTALMFWPIYVPLLLTPAAPEEPAEPRIPANDSRDDMAEAIAQVDAELDAALSSLDGWAEDVLARETERIQELRSAWNAQAERVRDMDRLLAQPEFSAPEAPDPSPSSDTESLDSADRRRHSESARRRNIERLRQVRRQAHEDLMGTLAWVRELVSMIHLAKFTGAPASRAEELVAQIAAAVEGVSAVTWQEEAAPTAAECVPH